MPRAVPAHGRVASPAATRIPQPLCSAARSFAGTATRNCAWTGPRTGTNKCAASMAEERRRGCASQHLEEHHGHRGVSGRSHQRCRLDGGRASKISSPRPTTSSSNSRRQPQVDIAPMRANVRELETKINNLFQRVEDERAKAKPDENLCAAYDKRISGLQNQFEAQQATIRTAERKNRVEVKPLDVKWRGRRWQTCLHCSSREPPWPPRRFARSPDRSRSVRKKSSGNAARALGRHVHPRPDRSAAEVGRG